MAHEMGHLFGKARFTSRPGLPDHPLYYQRRGGSGTHCAHLATWTPDPTAPALNPTTPGEMDAQGNGAGRYDNGECIMFGIAGSAKREWCKHCALDFFGTEERIGAAISQSGHVLTHGLKRVHDSNCRLCLTRGQFGRSLNGGDNVADFNLHAISDEFDVVCTFFGSRGKRANFLGDHSKPAAILACPRGFDGCVECKQIGLIRDQADLACYLCNFVRPALQLGNDRDRGYLS
jgi:hypothetical protein